MSRASPRSVGQSLPRPGRPAAALAATSVLALGVGLLVVHRTSPAAAVAIALVPPVGWLLTRTWGGLSIGVVLILVLPYWLTLGSSHANVQHVAPILAAATFLVARRPRWSSTDLALVAFLGIVLLDWLLRANQLQVRSLVTSEFVPVGFYLGARALPPRYTRSVLLLALFAGTIGALTVIYEYIQGHAVFVDSSAYYWNANEQSIFRPGGIFGSPPGAATVLSFVIFFGLASLPSVRGKLRMLAGASLGICGLALILTFTRANIIATGVGVLALLWLVRSPLLRPLRVAWCAALLVATLVFTLPAVHSNTTYQRGVLRGGNLSARIGYWKVALPIASSSARNFVLGIGTGTLEVPAHAPGVTIPSVEAVRPQVFDNSLHSEYVTTLVEQGAVGLLALAALLLVPFVGAARAAWRHRDVVQAGLAASILSMMIAMTVDTTLLHGPSFAMLMVACGLSVTARASRYAPETSVQ